MKSSSVSDGSMLKEEMKTSTKNSKPSSLSQKNHRISVLSSEVSKSKTFPFPKYPESEAS